MSVKRIRIFTGGRMGHAKSFFTNARGHIEAVYGDKIIVETIDTDVIKEEGRIRTPKEFIDWFLGADIHIICSHLHQGLDDLSWDMEELLEEYKRLRGHIGYTGGALDPVFLQDKIMYLLTQSEDDYLPTLKIEMPTLLGDGKIYIGAEDVEAVQNFVFTHKQCVVKTPFTTHGSLYRGNVYCNSIEQVWKRIKRLAILANKAAVRSKPLSRVHRVPYLMIQPRVDNKEYKVLVLNGHAKVILTAASGFRTPVQDIYQFAEKVVAKLKERCPETMTEYILRVDLFEVDGKLKVNEFESFEADIFLTRGSTKRKYTQADGTILGWTDNDTGNFVTKFWTDKFHELISLAFAAVL